ncbi:MAG: hypothetical protein NTX53_09855 [candidate division WOR-3 bacterium]|nr:hypothetical protein [candidate division WOR-3 bacterium]
MHERIPEDRQPTVDGSRLKQWWFADDRQPQAARGKHESLCRGYDSR